MVMLIRRETAQGVDGVSVPVQQPYLVPSDTFAAPETSDPIFWTCVRTRPRWEKKFTAWLTEQRHSYFLPVLPHETVSSRKRRVSEIPLFPGFVFVRGNHNKGDFDRLGNVVYVLKPHFPHQIAQLHEELRSVWTGLTSGLYVTPVQNLASGESCRITRGPLQGTVARFERMGRNGRVILQVELLGGGLAVSMSADEIELVV